MKNLILLLSIVCSGACAGEPFEEASFEAIGGDAVADAGEAPVGASGAPVAVGGSGNAGGKATGGSPVVAGAPAAGSPGAGGAPTQCDLDPTLIASALPSQIVWSEATHAVGEECVQCRDATCATIDVVSWGTPVFDGNDGSYAFVPNTNHPMVPVTVGKNDGMCTQERECGVKMSQLSVKIWVEQTSSGLVVTKALAAPQFESNSCTSAPFTFATDFSDEFSAIVKGLEIPCDS